MVFTIERFHCVQLCSTVLHDLVVSTNSWTLCFTTWLRLTAGCPSALSVCDVASPHPTPQVGQEVLSQQLQRERQQLLEEGGQMARYASEVNSQVCREAQVRIVTMAAV